MIFRYKLPAKSHDTYAGGENKDHFGFTWGPFDASGLSLLGNLSASNSDKDVLFYWGQQGWTHNLFHNKYHSRALFEMGLRVDTAFGSAPPSYLHASAHKTMFKA